MRLKKIKSSNIILLIILILVVILILLIVNYSLNDKQYPIEYEDIVNTVSAKNNIDPALVFAIINAESGFDSDAKSQAGAVGLMQIMPDTAEWISEKLDYGEYDLYNPVDNIELGCWYVSFLVNRFSSLDAAIAAYNAGQGNVDNWLQNSEYSTDGESLSKIPFKETSDYVDRVLKAYEKYKEIV